MKTLALALLAGAALATPAVAQSAGEFTVGVGLASVMPKDGNGTLDGGLKLNVGNNARPTITVEYFVQDNVGIELLAATPFQHDIDIKGMGKVGTTKHLPPTISVNYHFPMEGNLKPFVGAGLNYTAFFTERTTGALKGADLDLKESWGLALHAGADYWMTDKDAIRADLRWIDIDSKVKLNGKEIGTAKIDPLVVGVSYIRKF